jgi:pectate lyase
MKQRLLSLGLLAVGALILYGCGGAGDGAAGTGGATANGGSTGEGGAGGSTGSAGTSGNAGTTGIRGTTGTSGATGTGGRGGTTGAGGATGNGGTTGTPATASLCTWPTAASTVMVNATITITGVYDGTMRRFAGAGNLGTSSQGESQDPIFHLVEGATLQNVILGNPAADGVHCDGNCTLKNVWWEDVGEDAATLKGTSPTQVMTIDGGGAQKASDKVFQHNGPGTMIIRNFCAQDFGKLYRSCGNCTTQYARHVQLQNVLVVPSGTTSALVGVNTNYNDTATFGSVLVKAASNSITICQRYTGNNTGAEPPKNGSGADGTVCMYAAGDVTWMP